MRPTDSPEKTVAQFYAANRGGGLYSEAVSQRLGAVIAYTAARLGLTPTTLTLSNLVLGVATSSIVAVSAPAMARGDIPTWLIGGAALLGWQLAYAADCADGQLARVTHTASPAGARVDLLVDLLVQISFLAALSCVATTYRPTTPGWLVTLFAATWIGNLAIAVMHSGELAASLITSRSLPVRVLKLLQDYGAVVALCGLILTVAPSHIVWVMAGSALVKTAFLVVSIGYAARRATSRQG